MLVRFDALIGAIGYQGRASALDADVVAPY